MRERRRFPRIPLVLDVELKRAQWERHLTEDVSRRGMFIRLAGSCPVAQLIQVRVFLPGEEDGPLEMMARVARRLGPDVALTWGRLPGIGLEFFCLGESVLEKWDRFVTEAARRMEILPNVNGYALYRELSSDNAPLAPVEEGASSHLSSEDATPDAVHQENRANLIFRAGDMVNLQLFLEENLKTGRYPVELPRGVRESSEAVLRIIHPTTEEEFLLPGNIRKDSSPPGYALCFDPRMHKLESAFEHFVNSGTCVRAFGGVA